ncbi:MAG: hypothetical protein HOB73_00535 [Planctomycetaceae bacterium]|jgi:tetratricopeptide (TPR) repeat protein|nr:hypothetical protein [Planctomycetaceae bacterium]
MLESASMTPFDPYHKWLGIPVTERPISKYRLLGIGDFESDREVISTAAERQTVFLRTMQAGEHAVLVAELLNEVSQARVTLLNADQKTEYDEELRELHAPEPEAEPTPPPIPVVQTPAPTPFATPVSQPKPTPIPVVQTPAQLQNIPLPTSQTSTPFATPQISITTPRRLKRRARGKVFKVAVASVIGTVTVITLILALSDYSRTPPKLTPEQLLILEEERVESYQLNQKQVEIDQLVDNAIAGYRSGRYHESDKLFNDAINLGNSSDANLNLWLVYQELARSHEHRGDYVTALIHVRKAIQLSLTAHDEATSIGDEGVYLIRNGEHEKGLARIGHSLTIEEAPWNSYYMGRELRILGRFEEAVPYLKKSIELGVTNGWALWDLGEIELYYYADYTKGHEILIQLERDVFSTHINMQKYWHRRAYASSKLANWDDVIIETNRGLATVGDDEYDERLVGMRTMAIQRLGKTTAITSGGANSATGNSGLGNMGSLPKSLTTGLLLYLPLDGKYAFGDPGDQNDHQLKVDVSGAVLTEDRFGRRNGAYRFDGKDDRIVVEYGGLPTGDSTRSIAVSFHASGIRLSSQGDPRSENLVSLGDGTFGLEGKRFSLGIRGEELFLVGQNRDRHFEVTKLHDQWCTYIVTFKGEIGECYVNGMPVSQFEHKLDTASAPLVIGSNTLSRNDEFFKGTIDEVLVYDRAMSLTEIKALDAYLSNKPTPKQATTIQDLMSQINQENIRVPEAKPSNQSILPAELKKLTAALKLGRAALSERNLDITAEQLAIAEPLARSGEPQKAFIRLERMYEFVKLFLRLTNEAIDNYERGSEIKLGQSTVVVVVETSPQDLTIRIAGSVKTYLRNQLSTGLAMGIADTNFEESQFKSTLKAAFVITQKNLREFEMTKAREFWEMGPESLELFEGYISDDYRFASE